ncbi:hypothetical protein FA09DRAFT_101215 [Tilletiopsis washingtonensis]|uniref:Secreted protein n=1 Tax=Tilletiopsis washingtonensis TaxID=58919 RepID=A0A316Z2E4_9BASI|nr:hypothetical protein FA09DRAFT_101215 [Tilletiopsis washingtonensis]PWN95960.1 hypothetical protein FA09DRAFT_101215 [Tilletiopsis washingtonensis]
MLPCIAPARAWLSLARVACSCALCWCAARGCWALQGVRGRCACQLRPSAALAAHRGVQKGLETSFEHTSAGGGGGSGETRRQGKAGGRRSEEWAPAGRRAARRWGCRPWPTAERRPRRPWGGQSGWCTSLAREHRLCACAGPSLQSEADSTARG